MLLGLWQWERPGSEPRLFWDGTEHHTGDGHHTIQALQAAHDWLIQVKAGDEPGIIDDALHDRFMAGLIILPDEIPCYVVPGNAQDAKRYSLRAANRISGMKLTNEHKRAGAWDTITDLEMLADVVMWICERTDKAYAKFADTIPSDRAIAEYLGNVSAPTVAEVWAEALEADSNTQWPWLFVESRMGLDGKVQKIKVKEPKPEPKAPATPPQVKELAPENEVDPIGDDAVNRSGNSVNTSTSTPAPTDNAPVTPGKTYSGKERLIRIKELAEKAAASIVQTIAGEMKVKGTAEDAYECLADVIAAELEVYVLGEED
jgi:hypothetical protein